MNNNNKSIKDLQHAPYNPRKITDKQLQILNKSMREFGDLSGIVFNVATNNIVGGHQRTKVLDPEAIIQKEQYQDDTGTTAIGYIVTSEGKFSYREVNWTEQKEKAANIVANKAGGEWDFTKLKDLIEELDTGDFDLELTGFDTEEIENLMTFVPEGEVEVLESKEDDFNTELPKTPITVLGDLYELNKHRLHCADSTDITAVEKLMNGEKADLLLTDPPYGYSYESNHQKKFKMLENDDKLLDFLPNALMVSKENCAFYVFGSWQTLAEWVFKIKECSLNLKNIIVWKKNNWSMGDLEGAYAGQYEIILFAHKGRVLLNGERERDVWEFDREPPKMHPTMKPISLLNKVLNNSSKLKDIVLDLFLGSGSTLIACEQLNRICYGQELDPKYCDVIIKRYVTYMKKENKPYKIKRNGVILSENDINQYFNNEST